MNRLRRSFLVIASLITLVSNAFARDITDAEKAMMQTRVTSFNAAFNAGDYAPIFDRLPPKMQMVMADRARQNRHEHRSHIISTAERFYTNIQILETTLDVTQMTYNETPNGRVYVLAPTVTVMGLKHKRHIYQLNTFTLAFPDKGAWYVFSIDDAKKVHTLTQAYPDFRGVDFGQNTLKILR